MSDSLQSFIQCLRNADEMLSYGVGLTPGAEEIADMLWLAKHLPDSVDEVDREDIHSQDAAELDDDKELGEDAYSAEQLDTVNEEVADKLVVNAGTTAQSASKPLMIPAAAALRQPLKLARSLRPLVRKVGSRTQEVIDEEATAIAIAENNPVGIVKRPAKERWFDLELVVEQSRVSSLWTQTSKEFIGLLERLGAFRTVRVWTLKTYVDGEGSVYPSLISGLRVAEGESTRVGKPKELIDSSGRRLIMLLSDCISPLWRQGIIHSWLSDWGKHGPTVIIQWFPTTYWARTGLRSGDQIWLSALSPGVSTNQLNCNPVGIYSEDWTEFEEEHECDKSIVIPTASIDSVLLGSWAQVVSGYGGAQVQGRRFRLSWDGKRWKGPSRKPRQLPSSGADRIQRFSETASEIAKELALLMSLGPVSPEITNLIQETLLPQSNVVHVAEVFLSGLIEPKENDGYRFVSGIKKLLKNSALAVDERLLFQVLSRYISTRFRRTPREFRAFLQKHDDWSHDQWNKIEGFAELRERLDHNDLERDSELNAAEHDSIESAEEERKGHTERDEDNAVNEALLNSFSDDQKDSRRESSISKALEEPDVSLFEEALPFIDRTDLLTNIFDIINSGSSVSLVGASGVGKTALLRQIQYLASTYLTDKRQPVYLDLLSVEDDNDFYFALCSSIDISNCKGFEFSRTVRSKRVLLLLDEFGVLSTDSFSSNIRNQLRALSVGKDAPFRLVTASRQSVNQMFPDDGIVSPLSGTFREITVPSLTDDDADITSSFVESVSQNNSSKPIEVVISYSREDESVKDELYVYLNRLKRDREISFWYDRINTEGNQWPLSIDKHLESAEIILLLVSSHFVSTERSYSQEVARIMERLQEEKVTVIPIITEDCDWMNSSFGKLSALPRNAKPISAWSNRNKAWLEIMDEVDQAIEAELLKRTTANSQQLNLNRSLPNPNVISPSTEGQRNLASELIDVQEGSDLSTERDVRHFQGNYIGHIEMYADAAVVAGYLDASQDWFRRCAQPMAVEPIEENCYSITVGKFKSLNHEVEPKIGLHLLPQEEGVYRIETIPIPGYEPVGYDVDFNATATLHEATQEDITIKTITRVEWEVRLSTWVEIPRFIQVLPDSMISASGDRLLNQIVRQVSKRLIQKVQSDFHTKHNLPIPSTTKRRFWQR